MSEPTCIADPLTETEARLLRAYVERVPEEGRRHVREAIVVGVADLDLSCVPEEGRRHVREAIVAFLRALGDASDGGASWLRRGPL